MAFSRNTVADLRSAESSHSWQCPANDQLQHLKGSTKMTVIQTHESIKQQSEARLSRTPLYCLVLMPGIAACRIQAD
jgi:hypothetical protein